MNKHKTLAFVTLLIGFMISVLCIVDGASRIKEDVSCMTVRDTITDTVWKTVVKREPAIHDTVRLYTRLERLPQVEQKCDGTIIVRDTVFVQVENTQVHYKDTLYEAWVSGHKPKLDSIKINIPYEIKRVTTIKKQSPFGIGPHVGMGVCGKGIYPYVGVGVQYNLIRF